MISPTITLFTLLLIAMVSLFSVILVLYFALLLVGAPLKAFWRNITGLMGQGTRKRYDF